MAQHDYVIANGTGAAVRSDLNNALAAIVSQNSGATEPATTYAYQWWADTTTSLLKLRNSANSGWITLFQLDGEWSTIALENGTAAAPSIYFKDSGTDTGIYSPGADQVAISTGGTGRLFVDTSGNVGIGTGSPSNYSNFVTLALADTSGAEIDFIKGSTIQGSIYNAGDIFYLESKSTVPTAFVTNGVERLRITSGGLVGIGSTAPNGLLALGFADAGSASLEFRTTSYSNLAQIVANNPSSDTGEITFRTRTGGSAFDRVKIDGSGRLLVGTSTAGGTELIQVQGVSGSSTAPGGIALRRSSISNTDDIGFIAFTNASGNAHAQIKAFCDGTPGASDYPGALTFSTCSDGSASPSERVRINASGQTLVGTSDAGQASGTGIKLLPTGQVWCVGSSGDV